MKKGKKENIVILAMYPGLSNSNKKKKGHQNSILLDYVFGTNRYDFQADKSRRIYLFINLRLIQK